jgi:hypothetical protein
LEKDKIIIPSSAILHGCFGRLGDASIDPDFHSSEWTLVRNKRNNRMKGDKDRKISKFDFGTQSFKTKQFQGQSSSWSLLKAII